MTDYDDWFLLRRNARMAKSVDAPDLKSDALGHAGSSPAARTKKVVDNFDSNIERNTVWNYQMLQCYRTAWINEILYGWMGLR